MAALKLLWKRLPFMAGFAQEEETENQQKLKKKEDILTRLLSPFESYVVIFQSLLIWEKPVQSAFAFTFCNILFWFIVYCQYRFYFLIASATALSYIYRTWTRHIWPEIRVPVPENEDSEDWTPVNPQVFSVPEISRYLSQISDDAKLWVTWLINLRQNQPGSFCFAVTSGLVILCCIGKCVSGVLISYFIMCLILMGPGFVVHIYPHMRHAIISCEIFAPIIESGEVKVQDDPVADELFPESNEEMVAALETALEASVNAVEQEELEDEQEELEDEQEELDDDQMGALSKDSEDFTPNLTMMPSYDKYSDSETEVGEPALTADVVQQVAVDSMMKFVTSHYEDVDSDEAEEEKLAEGLVFGDELDNRLSCPRDISSSSTTSSQQERFEEAPVSQETIGQKKSPSRRPSQQSDLELSDFELISESELS